MARRQSLAWVELRVGLLVVVSFGLLAAAIFFVGGERGFFTPKYTVTAYFSSANGMNNGADVHLEGVTVGNVQAVRLTEFSRTGTVCGGRHEHRLGFPAAHS